MSQAVVRIETPEEREYARFQRDVESRQRRIADLRAELDSLKLTLARFEAEYHACVGILFVELDRARLAIAEYERRIDRLQAVPDADPGDVERDVGREFGSRREEVRTEEEETRRYERLHRQEQERPQLNAQAEDEIRRLYRDLARRYHPDLARTDEERRRREPLMQRVNAAMRERDIAALRDLLRQAEVMDPAFEARTIGEKLVWAIREVARLDEVIADLEGELTAVRASETHRLWSRQQSGEAVIELLERDLKAKIATEQDRLAELILTYRQLLERRAM
ncbi:MAG: J domain-containing protein [Chloroflexota bacterium]|nr:J domain-containing protein [Chloroflexota bacterium]